MGNALSLLFTAEEINRITERIRKDGTKTVTIDVHGLNVPKAKRLIQNIVALNREGADIHVIHGYNHGTAIKRMVTGGELKNKSITSIRTLPYNPGETVLKIKAA